MKLVSTLLLSFFITLSFGQVSINTLPAMPVDMTVEVAAVYDGEMFCVGTENGSGNETVLHLKDGQWSVITTQNSGILSDVVNDVQYYDGSFYFATDKGLSEYNSGIWYNTILFGVETTGEFIKVSVSDDGYILVQSDGDIIYKRRTDSTWSDVKTDMDVISQNILNNFTGRALRPMFFNGSIFYGVRFSPSGGLFSIDLNSKLETGLPFRVSDLIVSDKNLYITSDSGVFCYKNKVWDRLVEINCLNHIPMPSRLMFIDIRGNLVYDQYTSFYQGLTYIDSIGNLWRGRKSIWTSFYPYINDFNKRVIYDAGGDKVYNIESQSFFDLGEYFRYSRNRTENSTLDINNMQMAVPNQGILFSDYLENKQQVPKGQCKSVNFTGGLWIGGVSEDSNVHLAGMTYRQRGQDFWPGPLDTVNATIPEERVNEYDRTWKVSKREIQQHVDIFKNNGQVMKSETTESIWNWPGNGKSGVASQLAPFVDLNANGIYEPQLGDYPDVPGDQCVFWIMNDAAYPHTETQGRALGIEIHGMAYAFDCPSVSGNLSSVNNSVFYRLKVINRSDTGYTDVVIGTWNDIDLGNYVDDYVGCHVTANLGYGYNGDDLDEGEFGFGKNPPMSGLLYLHTPTELHDGIDGDGDGEIDEEDEKRRMGSFVYYNNNANPVNGNPKVYHDFFNLMNGRWMNSESIEHGGDGLVGTNGAKTKYMFPRTSNPDNPSDWSEFGSGNTPADRRFLMSTYPFDLASKQEVEFEFANIYSRDESQYEQLPQMLDYVESIKSWYYDQGYPECFNPVGIEDIEKEISATIYPNPTNGSITLQTEEIIRGVEVYTLAGLLVEDVSTANANSLELNLSSLTKGVYVIHIETDEGVARKKVVKL